MKGVKPYKCVLLSPKIAYLRLNHSPNGSVVVEIFYMIQNFCNKMYNDYPGSCTKTAQN